MKSNPQTTNQNFDSAVDENSVDAFLRELEEKENELHITAETSIIEIPEESDGGELPGFLESEFNESIAHKAASPAMYDSYGRLQDEVTSLKLKVSELESERSELIETAKRRSHDFENLKTRTERERRETFQNQIGNLATQMLPALDNLNRALDFAFELPDDAKTRMQPFIDGVVLVNQQVNDVLAGMGIVPIQSIGCEFDPNFHEAVATEESDTIPAGRVAAEVLRGYRIGDRVI
ncbi:MAG: nucleotide exchange factor GrpE, partial [Acidobacteria bacterium]|nr:nucleotide exchange factor GrpE [Acidobacteriota bacterium]